MGDTPREGSLGATLNQPSSVETAARVLVAWSCLTLCDPVDCSPPGSSVHGVLQARILEWVAIPFSRGSSQPRDQTLVSCTADRFFTMGAIRKAHKISTQMGGVGMGKGQQSHREQNEPGLVGGRREEGTLSHKASSQKRRSKNTREKQVGQSCGS